MLLNRLERVLSWLKIIYVLFFARDIGASFNSCQWQDCSDNQKCLFWTENEYLAIRDQEVSLYCNLKPPRREHFQCLETKNLQINKTTFSLFDCIYNAFNINEFLQELKPVGISIHQKSNTNISFQMNVQNMSFLRYFDIDGVQSKGILNLTLNSLERLEIFSITNTHFTSLAKEPFGDLPKLEYLVISNSSLGNLPENIFHGLYSLKELLLDSNRIEEVKPLTFRDLSQLRYLDLQDNVIKSLKSEIFLNLTKLVTLYINNNQLETLPLNLFKYLPTLSILKLGQNENIKDFQEGYFKGAQMLEELDASECSLETLQETLFITTSNRKRRNFLRDTSDKLALKEEEEITQDTFIKRRVMRYSKRLSLKRKRHVTTEYNYTMNSLNIVYLSHNKLTHIKNKTFDPCVNLIVIDLSHNPILHLPTTNPFGSSRIIEEVILSNCELTKFLDTWELPRSLIVLALDNNKLETLPPVFTSMVNSSPDVNLFLSGNSWRCDCNNLDYPRWLIYQKEKVIDYKDLICVIDNSTDNFSFQNNSILQMCSGALDDGSTGEIYNTAIYILMLFALIIAMFFGMLLYEHSLLITALTYSQITRCIRKNHMPLKRYKLFNAFICFAKSDGKIVKKISKKLKPNNRICIHGETSLPVKGKIQSMIYGMAHTNVTLLILSRKFAKSSLLQVHFRSAHHRLAQKQKLIIIPIFHDDLTEEFFSWDLRTALSRTYSLRWKEKFFWKKLNYILYTNSG